MGKRRSGRIAALQVLYELDAREGFQTANQMLGRHFEAFDPEIDPDVRAFAETLVRGVVAQREVLDERIARASEHWRLERMARVDRNVVRLASFELDARGDVVPPRVVINEEIELAKAFGDSESGAFINGLLDRILRDLK